MDGKMLYVISEIRIFFVLIHALTLFNHHLEANSCWRRHDIEGKI